MDGKGRFGGHGRRISRDHEDARQHFLRDLDELEIQLVFGDRRGFDGGLRGVGDAGEDSAETRRDVPELDGLGGSENERGRGLQAGRFAGAGFHLVVPLLGEGCWGPSGAELWPVEICSIGGYDSAWEYSGYGSWPVVDVDVGVVVE